MILLKNIVDKEIRDELFDLYNSSDNRYHAKNGVTRRHVLSDIGKCLMSRFTDAEFCAPWKKISSKLDRSYGMQGGRIMRYSKGCFLPLHFDKDVGLKNMIILMNNPKEYVGGDSIVENEVVDLELGDALIYDIKDFHGVTPVTEGVRYIANFFIKEL